ncbi:NUDIX hydrolase [Agriterribacter sp.]|uniref:NUDIX hydrolase n=1 Tax=Agriterribacter sp. TaxID=2821509 RepID=UPI002CF02268|nr:NUDIX domain-containing protein [Agriterribacter sp.]HTN08758.1 NUDIX domain-containing protein [Agriterribacter sp.]
MKTKQVLNNSLIAKEPVSADNFTVGVSVDCVIFGFEACKLKVLLIKSDMPSYKDRWSLLGDIVKPGEDIDEAVSRIVKNRTGLNDVYMEQVRTFGKVNRHPEGRVITIAYCSLINIRHNELKIYDNELHWHDVNEIKEMAFDHKEILDACYYWLQYRMQEHPLGLRLLGTEFSLRDLQLLYENILDEKMDRRNFRKKFFSMGLLIDTGILESNVPHRPGKLYRFDYEKYGSMKRKKWLGIDF